MQAVFAAALMGGPLPPGLDPRRFAIYRNNVFVGLTGALRARFPVTEAVLGPKFFAALARAYLRQDPPSDPVLALWGEGFPAFAARFPGTDALPWLGDLARLEAAWTRAYHAEDAAPARLEDLTPEGVDRLRLHPAVQVLASDWPVGTIWSGHAAGEPPKAARGAELVLIARPGLEVGVHLLPAADRRFVAALAEGRDLMTAAEAALSAPDFDFGRALTGLVRLGAFTLGERP